jgi:hypothetical protein
MEALWTREVEMGESENMSEGTRRKTRLDLTAKGGKEKSEKN